jgi:tRNA nucleotidyltransferase/poly(A) polymerase
MTYNLVHIYQTTYTRTLIPPKHNFNHDYLRVLSAAQLTASRYGFSYVELDI